MKPFVLSILFALATLTFAGCGGNSEDEVVTRAQAQLDKGDAKGAIVKLEAAYKANPKSDKILEALGLAQMNNGDALRGGELLNTLALRSSPDDHLYAAASFKKAGNLDKAIEAYRLFLLSETKQAPAWNDYGQTLLAAGKTPEAIAALSKACELAPTPELAVQIAELCAKTSPAQTQRYLQSALKQARANRPVDSAPTEIEGTILVNLISSALADHKLAEATRHFKQLERDFPKHAQLDALRKALDAEQSKSLAKTASEVRSAMKSLIATAPAKPADENRATTTTTATNISAVGESSPQTASTSAVASTTSEAPAGQPTAASTSPEASNASSTSADSAAAAALETKPIAPVVKAPEAVRDATGERLMSAVQNSPKDATKWATLAAYKAKTGDLAWAEAAYLEALRITPGNPTYVMAYLKVVSDRRPPHETLDEAEKFLAKYPEIPDLYLFAARIYWEPLRNARNASILYRQYLKKFPNDSSAAKAKAELDALPKM